MITNKILTFLKNMTLVSIYRFSHRKHFASLGKTKIPLYRVEFSLYHF